MYVTLRYMYVTLRYMYVTQRYRYVTLRYRYVTLCDRVNSQMGGIDVSSGAENSANRFSVSRNVDSCSFSIRVHT